MDKLKSFFTNKYVVGFGAGIAASIIVYRAYKSRRLRKAAVKILAQGMKIRDEAKFAVNTMKEEAEDLCAEAKEKNAAAETL
jgi:predicted small secreted protein